jgi:DNA repair exonuclease SbcCD nuclease subunit
MKVEVRPNRCDLILCGDIHLRETSPICYTGDYYNDQFECLDFISDLQKEYQCEVICSGDLFDFWKPSLKFLSDVFKHLPQRFYSVAGNHDLPQHNLDLINKSGLFVLHSAGALTLLPGRHWGQEFKDFSNPEYDMLVWHVMTYQQKLPYIDCNAPNALKILKRNPKYKLILTGDNHTPFVERYEGRILINPGSMMRMEAGQIDYKPRVYLYNAEQNDVFPVYLPRKENVITREHIEKKEQKEEANKKFIESLVSEYNVSMSFEDNLRNFQTKNDISKDVLNLIYKAIDNEKS